MMSAKMVTPGGRVADIGCDHAHTCIYLIKNGIAQFCIGMDVREGPLEKAAQNIALYGSDDKIELRKSYGLDALKPGEVSTIIIAGMGGELVQNILSRDILTGKVSLTVAEIILQPQSKLYEVRDFLDRNGFVIVDEAMSHTDDKFYTSMKILPPAAAASASADTAKKLSGAEKYFGPVLLQRRDSVTQEYIELEYRKKKRLLERISTSDKPEASEKYAQINSIFKMIEGCR